MYLTTEKPEDWIGMDSIFYLIYVSLIHERNLGKQTKRGMGMGQDTKDL